MNFETVKSMNKIPHLNDLKNQIQGLKTILFDMDGTLFNTERYHAWSLKELGQQLQIKVELTEHELYHMMVGKADHLLYDILKSWEGFPNDWTVQHFIENKNTSLLKILKKVPTEDFFSEQLRALLDQAKKEKLTIGLVTSSEKIITQELLKISKTYDYFDLILTRDDSLKVKPDPWPYLFAMSQLNCLSHETLIFEDSNVGMEAALNSGANVIRANWYEN